MAVLQDYPSTGLYALVDDGFSSVTLTLAKGLVLDDRAFGLSKGLQGDKWR